MLIVTFEGAKVPAVAAVGRVLPLLGRPAVASAAARAASIAVPAGVVRGQVNAPTRSVAVTPVVALVSLPSFTVHGT